MSLTRRRLLRAAGGAGLAGLAGCLGDDSEAPESADGAETNGGSDDRPVGSIRTLDRGCAGEDTTAIETTRSDETVRVEGRIAAPTPRHRATLETVESGPDTLRIVVGVRDRFRGERGDCDGLIAYEATVTPGADGPDRIVVEHATDGTYFLGRPAAGPTPAVGSTAFETQDTDCGSPPESLTDVSFDGNAVLVSGAQVVPNPCYEAVFGTATVADTQLRVSVNAVSAIRPEESCLQCRALVTYAGRVELDDTDGLSGVLVRASVE